MANDNHLLSIPCYNGTMLKQDYYNEFFELDNRKLTSVSSTINPYLTSNPLPYIMPTVELPDLTTTKSPTQFEFGT